jgi:hypothetical protein
MATLASHSSQYRRRSTAGFLFSLLAAITMTTSVIGCAAQPVMANPTQIIVKFQPEVANAESKEFLDSLAATAKVPVQYKRAMSGGAHVLVIDADEAKVDEALKALGKRKDVLYAEPDRKMKMDEKR